jgi:protocatechuate 3,4-dioxygenase beta subunit
VESLKAGDERTIEIRLLAGAAVLGRVTDRATGAALGGVRVSVAGSTKKLCVTGPTGDYRLEGLPADLVSIQAGAEDYPLTRVGVRVPEGEREVRQDFTLLRGATASGIVTDSQGRPVGGATVGPALATGGKALTGADGRFTLTGLPVERSLTLDAVAKGYVTGRSKPLRSMSGEVFDGVTIVLSRGGSVVGRVLDHAGNPAAGATVRLVPLAREGGVSLLPAATTGPDGQFTIDPVLPGDHRATATLRGTLGGSADVPGVTEGGMVGGIVIRLGAAESITGSVTDPAGQPVAGAQVSARPVEPIPGGRYASASAGEDGTFSLEGLLPGRYHVGVRSVRGGPEAAVAEVASGTTGVKLTLPSTGSISGRVIRPDGTPVANGSLRLSPVMGGGALFERLDPEGRGDFRIDGVTPGAYVLSASSRDGDSSAGIPVTVTAQGSVTGIVLTLDAPGCISGRVLSETGLPVADAQVLAAPAEQGAMASRGFVRSGPDGAFRLERLAPGTWRLQATSDGLVALVSDVVVFSGSETTADVRFLPTGSVLLTVVDAAGAPVAGASVHVRSAGGIFVPVRPAPLREGTPPTERESEARESRRKAGTTDESGVCLRTGIPEGEVVVAVSARGYELAQQTVVIAAGGTGKVQVVLSAAPAGSEWKRDGR